MEGGIILDSNKNLGDERETDEVRKKSWLGWMMDCVVLVMTVVNLGWGYGPVGQWYENDHVPKDRANRRIQNTI